MKIGIQTWGSDGDIRPFIALSEGLQAAGHDVTLVITSIDSDRFVNLGSRNGVNVISIASPVVADKKELQAIEEAVFADAVPTSQFRKILEKLFLPAEQEMFAAAEKTLHRKRSCSGSLWPLPIKRSSGKTSPKLGQRFAGAQPRSLRFLSTARYSKSRGILQPCLVANFKMDYEQKL